MAWSFCPRCGTARIGGFRFCRSCAFDYDAAPAPEPGAAGAAGEPAPATEPTPATPAPAAPAFPTLVSAPAPRDAATLGDRDALAGLGSPARRGRPPVVERSRVHADPQPPPPAPEGPDTVARAILGLRLAVLGVSLGVAVAVESGVGDVAFPTDQGTVVAFILLICGLGGVLTLIVPGRIARGLPKSTLLGFLGLALVTNLTFALGLDLFHGTQSLRGVVDFEIASVLGTGLLRLVLWPLAP